MTRPATTLRTPRAGMARWAAVFALAATAGLVVWPRPWSDGDSGDAAIDDAILHTVSRQDFSLDITERGEIRSAGGVEVKSQVRSNNMPTTAILRIVEEGTEVEEGDFLVELDSSALESDRLLQQITVNTAEATVVEARNLYETTLIAREEYLKGVFVQEQQTIQSEVFVAEENLSRAEEYLKYSQRLAAKGYVSELQLEADRFAVEKSQKEVEAAETKLRVLEDYTRAKTLKTLDSDVVIAKAKWESLKNSYQLELNKLEDIHEQIAACQITAPTSGVVKYAHGGDRGGGDNEFVVEEGAYVRERQTIIRLPDPTRMEVAVEVNESLIQHVKAGMPAAVRLVGANDRVLAGRVDRVNEYAEPTNWRRANVKDYKAYIAIDEASSIVKTGMTASVTISSQFVPDAVVAPVQSVYAHGDQLYCFRDRGGELEPAPVQVGPTNDRFFVIQSGLIAEDRIALNPRVLAERVDLPEIAAEQAQQAVDSGRDWRRLRTRQAEVEASGDTPSATATAKQGGDDSTSAEGG